MRSELPETIAELAQFIGVTPALEFWKAYAGQTLSVPSMKTFDRVERDFQIRAKQNAGAAIPDLCREFDLSPRQLRRILDKNPASGS